MNFRIFFQIYLGPALIKKQSTPINLESPAIHKSLCDSPAGPSLCGSLLYLFIM